MASSGASSLHDYFDYQAHVFRTGYFPRTRLSFVIKSIAAPIPFYVTA